MAKDKKNADTQVIDVRIEESLLKVQSIITSRPDAGTSFQKKKKRERERETEKEKVYDNVWLILGGPGGGGGVGVVGRR